MNNQHHTAAALDSAAPTTAAQGSSTKRWLFGYLRSGLHAAAENEQQFRGEPPTHMIRALCDGEWKRYDFADFSGADTFPEPWHPEVKLCAACRAKWRSA